jgi:hypothetical protein
MASTTCQRAVLQRPGVRAVSGRRREALSLFLASRTRAYPGIAWCGIALPNLVLIVRRAVLRRPGAATLAGTAVKPLIPYSASRPGQPGTAGAMSCLCAPVRLPHLLSLCASTATLHTQTGNVYLRRNRFLLSASESFPNATPLRAGRGRTVWLLRLWAERRRRPRSPTRAPVPVPAGSPARRLPELLKICSGQARHVLGARILFAALHT